MRIYLDTSVYNRPFDDQSQPRIWLETMALSVILQMIEQGEAELVRSAVVSYENSRNPFDNRRNWVTRVMGLAVSDQVVTPAIRERAEQLEADGVKALDALHVASAEAAAADYFITVDDRLIRRYEETAGTTIALDPVTFVRKVTGKEPK